MIAPDQEGTPAVGYVYALCEPETGDKRYVGMTSTTPAERLKGHIAKSGQRSPHPHPLSVWIRGLRARGLLPTVRVLEEVTLEHSTPRSGDRIRIVEQQHIHTALDAGCWLLNASWDTMREDWHAGKYPIMLRPTGCLPTCRLTSLKQCKERCAAVGSLVWIQYEIRRPGSGFALLERWHREEQRRREYQEALQRGEYDDWWWAGGERRRVAEAVRLEAEVRREAALRGVQTRRRNAVLRAAGLPAPRHTAVDK